MLYVLLGGVQKGLQLAVEESRRQFLYGKVYLNHESV